MGKHSEVGQTAAMHGVVRWTVADAAAREALTVSAGDVAARKALVQTDEGTLWVASATSSPKFTPLNGGANFDWSHGAGATSVNNRWIAAGGAYGAQSGTDNQRRNVHSRMILDRLYVRQTVAGTNEGNNVYVVQVDGVDTALTVTIANDSVVQGSDLTNFVIVNAGQELGLRTAHSATVATAATQVMVSCRGRLI